MHIGASSACFYPLETEKSLERVAKAGFKTAEIFFNTPSELEGERLRRLKDIKDSYGLNIAAVHPFMSFAEGYCIFSSYERRYNDYKDMYKRYFEVCASLGAGFVVLHGAPAKLNVSSSLYCDRFYGLSEAARELGVTLTQENIVHYYSQSPEFLIEMKRQLGDSFKMVLDIKQAYRAGYTSDEFVDKLIDSIVHIHISDHNREHDCLAPGEGEFDFASFMKKNASLGYEGAYIIELYSYSFSSDSQLIRSAQLLNKMFF